MKYLTPTYVQRFSGGISLNGVGNDEINMLILNAEAQVDAFCLTEHQPKNWHQVTPFPSGIMEFGIKSWPTPVINIQNVAVQQPVTAATGGLLTTALIPLNVNISNDRGWFSIISYAGVSGNISPLGYFPGINYPPVSIIFDYQTSYAIPYTGETLYGLSDNVTFQSFRPFWASTYPISVNVSPYVVPPVPPVIYVNGTVTTTGFTIDYTNGQVVFTSSQAGNTITADYAALIPDPVREAARILFFQALAERNPNTAGMAGLSSIEMSNQLSMTARNPYDAMLKRVENMLQPYRHTGLE